MDCVLKNMMITFGVKPNKIKVLGIKDLILLNLKKLFSYIILYYFWLSTSYLLSKGDTFISDFEIAIRAEPENCIIP
ncbi:Uncharacterised protein [Capnocytophaga canimorsus]|nr:hypothetical protein CLV61_1334 [Capnocytophaga canimorsus]STA73155.1 Uncharacterised protein [Capnocytophaga canimorsus]